jgi:hypothetical protein
MKYIQMTVEGSNAMVGKAIPFGAKGIILETLPKGFFVGFNHPELKHVFVSNDQCRDWEPCRSCEQLRINGTVTHEMGCPDAWRDEIRSCKWCGIQFFAEEQHQDCCGHTCQVVYHGLECDCI